MSEENQPENKVVIEELTEEEEQKLFRAAQVKNLLLIGIGRFELSLVMYPKQ